MIDFGYKHTPHRAHENDAGADVYDIGLSTTPMVYFGTANYGFKASVQITASHNPAKYNGLKVSRENALPVGFDTGLGQIQEWIESGRETVPAEVKGKVHPMDIKDDYLAFLLKYKADWSSLKIAMDVSNGMASLFVRDIFGDQPAYIYENMDGSFPNHEPNPLNPANIVDLQKLVAPKSVEFIGGNNGSHDFSLEHDGTPFFLLYADGHLRDQSLTMVTVLPFLKPTALASSVSTCISRQNLSETRTCTSNQRVRLVPLKASTVM